MRERAQRRRARERLLLALTGLPTAAGREDRVVEFVRRWVARRPGLALSRDQAGNVWIGRARCARLGEPTHPDAAHTGPIVFEAHLDHPAFVVTKALSAREAWAEFRGGVKPAYFPGARVVLHGSGGEGVRGRVVEADDPDESAGRLFRRARLAFEADAAVRVGEVATWALPAPRIKDGRLSAPACDDLAAVAAALCALEELGGEGAGDDGRDARPTGGGADVRVLLTRAEEVGFIGAIAACRSGSIPPGSRIIALENSRSLEDSPIGAGPIVRVGDRLSVFSPGLTAAVAKVAQGLADRSEGPVVPPSGATTGGTPVPPDQPTTGGFRWQRKLMPGGACEASAFCAFGHEATCVCLPLGNYHNMGRLDEVERAGAGPGVDAPIMPEEISVEDFHGMSDLLVACGRGIGAVEPMTVRLERLYAERASVLGSPASGPGV